MSMMNYLNLVLTVGAVVLAARSLALSYPDNSPHLKYKPVSLEYRPPVPVIHQHPETLQKKPSHWNHMPSPASATPVYTIKPPEHPVYPGNPPPPPACKASTAYVYDHGHTQADETGN